MNHEIRSITFEIKAHAKAGRFSLPTEIYNILNLNDKSDISLVVETEVGTYAGTKKLKSGHEIYGADFVEVIPGGARLRVAIYTPRLASPS